MAGKTPERKAIDAAVKRERYIPSDNYYVPPKDGSLAAEYEKARDETGCTVAEWEAERGLPQYSVYPEKRGVKEHIVGHYMYTSPDRTIVNGQGPRGSWPKAEGRKPKSEAGLWGPTKVGGEQAKQPSHQWRKQRFHLGPWQGGEK